MIGSYRLITFRQFTFHIWHVNSKIVGIDNINN